MTLARRAVGYIRVSDESQAEQDKASLSEQERAIREYCQRKGYELLRIFSDVGKRWDANRPAFKQMVSWGRETPRPFDIIVVWRADRIVGSASTVAALEPLLDRGGIDIEGVAEPVHKGWLLLNAIIAKGETEAKRHRGKLGIKTACDRGHFPGIAPYGRRWDKELKRMVVKEEEARWYREMFTWSLAGDGDAKIARRLNGLGVPTRLQGKVTKSGKTIGKGWTANYVRRLLTDPAAYGEAKIQVKGGDTFAFPLPPIVDRQTFELAQRARQSRRHFGHRSTNRRYLISPRKGKCRECGLGFRLESRSYQVRRKSADGESKVYQRKTLSPVLICRGMRNYPHIHRCRESKYIDFDNVQTAVLRSASEALSSDDFAWASVMPNRSEVERTALQLKEARDSRDQTLREISFVVTQGRTGIIPTPVFDQQMSLLNDVLEYKQQKVKELEVAYQNTADRATKTQQVIPLVNLFKDFWGAFKGISISSNRTGQGDGLEDLSISRDSMNRLREMLDIFVESFTIDRQNNITVQLSIPILEGIKAQAERCRQLTNIPYLNRG